MDTHGMDVGGPLVSVSLFSYEGVCFQKKKKKINIIITFIIIIVIII